MLRPAVVFPTPVIFVARINDNVVSLNQRHKLDNHEEDQLEEHRLGSLLEISTFHRYYVG